MGLLDTILGTSTSGVGPAASEAHSGLLDHVLQMAGSTQTGGLSGLVQRLTAGGLGTAVNSWVGNGPNQPVTGDQVGAAFGTEQISEIAQKFGLPPSQVSGQLAQILPGLINHLTPTGSVPDHGIVQSAIGMLKGRLAGN